MELEKIKIQLNNGETQTFEKNKDNIDSINLNEETGLIELIYIEDNEWDVKFISIHNVNGVECILEPVEAIIGI